MLIRRRFVRRSIGAAFVLVTTPVAAQHCLIPRAGSPSTVRVTGGSDFGGSGYAAGGSVALHAQRWFVAGEFADRGWGLGRRRYRGLPLPGFMERQHQVLGLRAGGVRALGARAAVCPSLSYAIGTGLRVVSSGDPQVGGAGFESHQRVRADVEVVHAVTIGDVRVFPALSLGLLFVREDEIQGDIFLSGVSGYVPITMTIGVPVGRHVTLRPRFNLPRGDARGTSYGIEASVLLTGFR